MKKVIVVIAITIWFVLFVNKTPSFACSPVPWNFEEAYGSKAMVYGKIIGIGNDGRKATLDVISYIGPGKAPKLIHLPETIDDRNKYPAGFSCPDFSMKFKIGEAYVFFLSGIPPKLQLLSPSYITAAFVEDGQVTVGLPRGETDSLNNRLQDFAKISGYKIQTPDSSSPIWGEKNKSIWFIIFLSIGLIASFVCIRAYRKS